MLLSSQMKEIASNKGEKVQPQVCVAGLSQRKFSVNDLQVQENCSDEPISGRGGCRFSDAKLRAIMAKAVFNQKNPEDHYSSVISFASMMQTERNHYWSVNSEPIKSGIICTLQYTLQEKFLGKL